MTSNTARWAAVTAAVIVCNAGVALAQTTAPQPAAPKPAAKPAASKPAAKPAAAAKPAPTSGKSVCVASIIGHRFEVQTIGLMVFGNSLEGASADSWGVDDAAVRKVQQILGNGFSVRRLAVPKAALTEIETPRPGAFFRNESQDFVRTVAGGAGKCDFYVTLSRIASSANGGNQYIAGLGIFTTGAPINERFYVFASYIVRLYDGNFAQIKAVSPKPDWTPSIMARPGTMFRQVDKSWWPASAQAAVQSAQLKNATRALVEEGLAKTLPGMLQQQ